MRVNIRIQEKELKWKELLRREGWVGYGSHFSFFIPFLCCFIVFSVTNENKIKRILDPFLQLAYNIMLVSGVRHSDSTFIYLTMWLPATLSGNHLSLFKHLSAGFFTTYPQSLPPPASKMLGGPVSLSSRDLQGSICFQQWQKFAQNNWRLLRGPFRVKSCRLLDISFAGLQGTLRAGEEASNCVCPWALIQRLQPSRPPPILFERKGTSSGCSHPSFWFAQMPAELN